MPTSRAHRSRSSARLHRITTARGRVKTEAKLKCSQYPRPNSNVEREDGPATRAHSAHSDAQARHRCEGAQRRTFAAPRDATAAVRVLVVLEELRRPSSSKGAMREPSMGLRTEIG